MKPPNEVVWHVYPRNDTKPHVTISSACWCNPKIKENGKLVVHNSSDLRELFEQDERTQVKQ